MTQELLTFALGLLGVAVTLGEAGFQAGKIWVPWSPGCSGYNGLILCVILTLWLGRHGTINRLLAFRLIGTIPAALAANILRILCILTFRYLAYPQHETPEMHFFIGFLTLMPMAFVLNRSVIRNLSNSQRLEMAYFAVVFSILIPVTWEPGGWQIALATFSLLALYHGTQAPPKLWTLFLWVGTGTLVGLTKMESLWLPWCLLCPFFVEVRKLMRRPAAWLLILSTITMVVMQSYWFGLLILALLVEWGQSKPSSTVDNVTAFQPTRKSWAATLCLSFPFVMPILPIKPAVQETIPRGAIVRELKKDQCLLQFVGQNEDLNIYWYKANNEGRHHAAATCMQFTGSDFERLTENLIATDSLWIFEQFIVKGKRVNTYREYLMHTWLPWQPSGVHLILTGHKASMDQDAFIVATSQALDRWFPKTPRGPSLMEMGK